MNSVINWSGWSPLGAPAGGITGGVAVNTNNLGNQELFVRSPDAQVYHNFATPGRGSGSAIMAGSPCTLMRSAMC